MKDRTTPPVIWEFLNRLRQAKIHFILASHRDDTIMVQIAVPGERWKVEFMPDGKLEIERFRSDGQIAGHREIEVLFRDFGD
jgi:hypothetical protein